MDEGLRLRMEDGRLRAEGIAGCCSDCWRIEALHGAVRTTPPAENAACVADQCLVVLGSLTAMGDGCAGRGTMRGLRCSGRQRCMAISSRQPSSASNTPSPTEPRSDPSSSSLLSSSSSSLKGGICRETWVFLRAVPRLEVPATDLDLACLWCSDPLLLGLTLRAWGV